MLFFFTMPLIYFERQYQNLNVLTGERFFSTEVLSGRIVLSFRLLVLFSLLIIERACVVKMLKKRILYYW